MTISAATPDTLTLPEDAVLRTLLERRMARARGARTLVLVSAILLLTAGPTPASSDPPGLDWLEGRWCAGDAQATIEETWLPARGDVQFGVSRTVRDGRVVAFEFLRIASVDGVATYLAQPGGRPPTAFRRTGGGALWVRFENPGHDFPTRIEYRRTGDALAADVAGPGQDGSEKVIAFRFTRCSTAPM